MLNASEIKKRVIFGVILGAAALFCTLYSAMTFYALVLIGALLMYAEWMELTKPMPMLNKIGGLIYVGLPVWSLIALRGIMIDHVTTDELGNMVHNVSQTPNYILFLFAVVWTTDIGAYFVGKRFGKHKLAPGISPGKTIEGLAGGVLLAAIVGAIGSFFVNAPSSILSGLLLGIVLGLIAQAGDLFESWLKRKAGVKDSSQLIPGHGGILDRVDGLVLTAPVYALIVLL